MIAKIEKLKNIGNFEDYNARGDVALRPVSIIYAENGAGKTTLSRVLHSLATDDGSVIERHKRIRATGNPEVVIRDDINHQHIYNGIRWNNPMPDIEVFDAHFVANNVYSGFEINSDHHKGLYQFVVGASGVAIVNKIERVKKMIATKNEEIKSLADEIRKVADYQDVGKICGLVQKPDIDNLIAEKEKELSLAKGQQQIAQQKLPAEITVAAPAFNTPTAQRVLETTVEGIGEAYLEEVKHHLDEMFTAGMQKCSDWVYQGVTLLDEGKWLKNGEKTCPFCGQGVDGVELVKGYNQYFSTAYRTALKNARDLLTLFEQINIESYLLRLKGQYEQIENAHRFWKNLLQDQPDLPPFDVDSLKLEDKYRALKSVIVQKSENPVVAVGCEESLAYKNALEAIALLCGQVNAYVKDYVARITVLRSKIRPVADVEKELRALKIYKARYEEPLKGYCTRFVILNDQWNRLNNLKNQLQQQQKAASAALFQQYGQATNNFLQNVFMTPFQIADVKDVFRGSSKRPNLEYTLTFNGTPILQGDDGGSNTSFKNVLSEGDKNTIAFSFFLAKLTQDPRMADKIVVFDDPLTSLDQNRRQETINQLVLLQNRCKQLIVLSHNFHFLIDFNARGEIKKANKKVLIIVKGRNTAEITPFELKREWMDKYKWSVQAMEDFANNPMPTYQENAINSIRLTMELMLKLKFCKYITNQDETFGEIITDLDRSPCTFINANKTEVIAKLKSLNSISWRVHHATVEERAVYQEVYLTMAEAVKYVDMALNMLYREL